MDPRCVGDYITFLRIHFSAILSQRLNKLKAESQQRRSVSPETLRLGVECDILAFEMDKYSLYLHVPFCRHRCSYCDFNTFAGQERLIPAYIDAICKEILTVSELAGGNPGVSAEKLPVHTVFFGGGTPSLLPVENLSRIIQTIREGYDLLPEAEITLEANPGTVSLAYLQELRAVGFNRLSFGMQSAHPDDLRLLERQHDFFDVVKAVQWARMAGFDNLSLDLIFGLPEQDLPRWQANLDYALNMHPDHLSLYSLTIEHGTPLYKQSGRGLIPIPDGDVSADMYEYAMSRLEEAGFVQYEISNWARKGEDGKLMSCRHNLQYWYNQPYLGLGAGAHGYACGVRTVNVGGIRPYIERCQANPGGPFPAGPATRRTIQIDQQMEMQETMMVGLRLVQEGVSARQFEARFGQPVEKVFGKEIDYLLRLGLVEWYDENNPHLRLTYRGRLFGNQVFMQFVGEA